MKVGEEKDVKIQKIVPGSFGLAFAEGITIFVSLAAPGDEARVRINQIKGKTAFAEILEIIKPSPFRVRPECPYFGACGGCDFQQMSYAAQLEAKVAIIRDCLTRIGKINFEKSIPIIASPKDYGYRSRAQWHLDTRAKKFGYFRRNSHDIIDVKVCPILTPKLQETLSDFRARVNWEEFWSGTVEIESATDGENVSVYSEEIVELTKEIKFQANGEKYSFDANSFFQGNQFLISELIKAATEGGKGERAIDLYCGVGLFTLPLARKFTRVFGVEANRKVFDFARKNIESARLENVKLSDKSVSGWLKENSESLKNIDLILLDPPRAGAERETIESLLQIKPKQISYVSCDPATLARDLRILTESFYAIDSITALDLFPQTHHVETVVWLKLKS